MPFSMPLVTSILRFLGDSKLRPSFDFFVILFEKLHISYMLIYARHSSTHASKAS